MPVKLTKNEEVMLLFLYEQKDKTPPNIAEISAATKLSQARVRGVLETLQEKGMIEGGSNLAQSVGNMLYKLEPAFKPTDLGYAEHIVMLASMVVGADENLLADELGYDREFVGIVGSRLRSGGIWLGKKLVPERRADWEKDNLSIWLDGGIATGALEAKGSGPKRKFRMTESGLKDVANLTKRFDGDAFEDR